MQSQSLLYRAIILACVFSVYPLALMARVAPLDGANLAAVFLDLGFVHLQAIILFVILSKLAIVDLSTMRLPNVWVFLLFLTGSVTAYLGDFILLGMMGVLVGLVLLGGVAFFYKQVRGVDGLGMGDIKVIAAAGMWTGPYAMPFILLTASLAGIVAALVYKNHQSDIPLSKQRIPFGPFLALGVWSVWCFQIAGFLIF